MEIIGHMITVGSRYLIMSMGVEETLMTRGTFRGYSALGGETALVMEIGDDDPAVDAKGRLRIIPIGKILAVEVIDARPPTEKEDVINYL